MGSWMPNRCGSWRAHLWALNSPGDAACRQRINKHLVRAHAGSLTNFLKSSGMRQVSVKFWNSQVFLSRVDFRPPCCPVVLSVVHVCRLQSRTTQASLVPCWAIFLCWWSMLEWFGAVSSDHQRLQKGSTKSAQHIAEVGTAQTTTQALLGTSCHYSTVKKANMQTWCRAFCLWLVSKIRVSGCTALSVFLAVSIEITPEGFSNMVLLE